MISVFILLISVCRQYVFTCRADYSLHTVRVAVVQWMQDPVPMASSKEGEAAVSALSLNSLTRSTRHFSPCPSYITCESVSSPVSGPAPWISLRAARRWTDPVHTHCSLSPAYLCPCLLDGLWIMQEPCLWPCLHLLLTSCLDSESGSLVVWSGTVDVVTITQLCPCSDRICPSISEGTSQAGATLRFWLSFLEKPALTAPWQLFCNPKKV